MATLLEDIPHTAVRMLRFQYPAIHGILSMERIEWILWRASFILFHLNSS